jgi:hypothetical protein
MLLRADPSPLSNIIEGESRFGWRKFARHGIQERWVELDYNNVLHESNLPLIVKELKSFVKTPEHVLQS